jgi:hypothetical protein
MVDWIGRDTPGAKAPFFLGLRPKAEALGYLEAKTRTTAKARAIAKARTTAKLEQRRRLERRQKRNAGISPLRRQKTPPSVEMTRSFVEVEENRQRQVQRRNAGSLRCGGKNTAFGRDDEIFVEVEENRQRQVQEQVMAVFGTLIEIGKRLYRYGDGKRDED